MENELNFMFDLETLGTAPRSVVLSIGAVVFYPEVNVVDHEFYIELNPKQKDRIIDPDTLAWWLKQDINPPLSGLVSLGDAVDCLSIYIKNQCREHNATPILWANGIDFDWGLLKEIYNDLNYSLPVKYNAVRDQRTLARLFPEIKLEERPVGSAHNALEDAKYQAKHLMNILSHITALQKLHHG